MRLRPSSVARIRTSTWPESLGALVACAALAACGGGALETATEMPRTPRRPDGVVLDPPPALPPAQERAAAAPVLALREPPVDQDVEEVVRAYLRAFEREDMDALVQLLAQDAAPIGRGGGRTQLVELWRGRLKSFEYQKLAGEEVAKLGQLERRSYDAYALPGAGPRPAEMRPGDVMVRVPIATPRVSGEQLFGDVLVLLLRREDGRLRIAGQADEMNGSP